MNANAEEVFEVQPILIEDIPKKINLKKRTRRRLSSQVQFGDTYQSLKDLYGIKESDCPIPHFVDSGFFKNFFDYARTSIANYFGEAPSGIVIQSLRLNSFISELKKQGDLSSVFSYTFVGTKPNCFCLLLKSGSSEIFIVSEDVKYWKVKEDQTLSEYDKEDYIDDEFGFIGTVYLFYKTADTIISGLVKKIGDTCRTKEFEEDVFIDMIISTQNGLQLKSIKLDAPKEIDLALHYGDNFPAYHEKLLERISSRNKGIVMLHGPPGTGKTYYIRSLISKLMQMEKRVILIPKHVISNLESPQFNSFMIDNFTNDQTVFIIEDAESIISKRDAAGGHRSELVSTILNITDGILNDIFNIQVILTFNTELTSIDDALLRKGRLISKYEFGPLNRSESIKLANSMGVNLSGSSSSYTLAEIFSMKDWEEDEILINQNISKPKSFVGF